MKISKKMKEILKPMRRSIIIEASTAYQKKAWYDIEIVLYQ
jgi:hypothetical protein